MTATISDAASNIARHGGIAPSRFDRLANDNYFTIDASWIIPALLSRVQIEGPILEPAAGVGHMVVELRQRGLDVVASDLYVHEDPLISDITIRDLRMVELTARLQMGDHESALSGARRVCFPSCRVGGTGRLQRRASHPRRMDRGSGSP